jgi:hypothetical protein
MLHQRFCNNTSHHRGFLKEGNQLTFITDARSKKVRSVSACLRHSLSHGGGHFLLVLDASPLSPHITC